MSQSGLIHIQEGNLPSDVPTQFITDSGTAVPISHVLFVNGAGTATTSVGASNQIIVTAVGSGDVVGPAIAVSGNFASFNGTSGKIIQDSGFTDSSFFKVANNLSEGNAATMRSNLGLGTLAVLNSPLGATNGGTSQNTYVSGDILYASAANTLSRLAKSTDGKVLTLAAGLPSWVTPSGGTVTSVSGTLNRITSTGGTTPVIDIDAAYVGQSSITTLGTIGTGTWQGSVIGGTYGGTGVNNGASTLTLGGSLTTSGAFASTFTMTAGTSVTFPTSGTLATTAQIPSLPLSLANGGTNANLTASNGGIFYSTSTAGAILAGTATAGQILRSGASTTPAWSTATYPATAGTSGNVLTSDGTNWASSAPSAGSPNYTFQLTNTSSNPADGQTYYLINGQLITAVTVTGRGRFYIPINSTIKSVYGAFLISGTLGSSENTTVAVRLNDTSNTNVTTTLQFTSATSSFSNSGLSVSVSAGDFIELLLITPTWGTNPTNVSSTITIYLG